MSPFGKNKKIYAAAALFVASIFVFLGLMNLYTQGLGWELPKTTALKREHEELRLRAELLSRKLSACQDELLELGIRDDNVYRSIFGLSPVSFEKRMAVMAEGDEKPQGGVETALGIKIRSLCDTLLCMSYVQSVSYDAISGMVRNAGDMADCVPAISPMLLDKSVTFSSPFGYRFHPVLRYRRFHSGIDLATKRGRPVYATGDGIVEKEMVEIRGYGRQIFINHGFGYKTRYAHLDQILLPEGVRVKRGEQIATSGNTGLSSGPHLHYEVYYKGQSVNPKNYFDMDMPQEQYKDMIASAAEKSEKMMKIPGKR